MGGLVRVGATPNYNDTNQRQRSGNDSVYGPGLDGTVVISTNTTLSRDMYYDNLTVNSNVTLNTNGFRIFVKNSLLIDGSIACSTSSSTGTISGPRALGSGNVLYSIGGNSASNLYTASQLTDGQKADILTLITGVISDPTNNFVAITGGAAGANGNPGTVTPAGPAGSGHLSRNPGVAGGPGTTGTTPPAAVGGTGGVGGGLVLICAKSIAGTGTIASSGANSSAGGNSATGTAGTSASSATLHHSTDGHASYNTGDGTGPVAHVSAPNVPHGSHVPATSNALHGHTWRHVHVGTTHHNYYDVGFGLGASHNHYDHGERTAGQHDFGHHHSDFNNTPHVNTLTGTYFAINGIPHTTPHRNHTGVAYSSDHSHSGGHYHTGSDTPHHGHHHGPGHNKFSHGTGTVHYAYPRSHADYLHQHQRHRQAGTISHSGSNVYPGGAGGTAGSTSSGQSGYAGGGGGIIIITDSISNSVVTSTTGGVGPDANGQSGSTITIINT